MGDKRKMTKEQIKEKAEAEADKVIIGSGMDRTSVIHLKHLLVTMYIQGATKVTKELEKENAELKEELKTAYRKGMRHMAKALKDYDRTDGAWTDYFEHTVDTVLQREQVTFEEYGTLADQILKAKSILALFLDANDNDDMLKAQREAWEFLGMVNPNERFEVTEKRR